MQRTLEILNELEQSGTMSRYAIGSLPLRRAHGALLKSFHALAVKAFQAEREAQSRLLSLAHHWLRSPDL